MKKKIVIVSYLIISFLIIIVYLNYSLSQPIGQSDQTRSFIINKGEGFKEIATRLEKDGLIKNRHSLFLYVFFKNLRKKFLPGEYFLSPSMSAKEIVNLLTTSNNLEKNITIIEGLTVKEIAEYLEREKIISSQDFLKAVQNDFSTQYDFLKDKPIEVGLEGFLFPDTYRIFVKTSGQAIIKKMLDNFDQKLTVELREEIKKQGKSIFEIITLASLIEKEAWTKEEMPKIAGVFINRLKSKLPLQSDATINYFTGKKDRQAKFEDTKKISPYNTYLYLGLPPGPIANPGLAAIKAAIYPAEHSYLYFLHPLNEPAIFSRTLEEHNQNKAKFLKTRQLNYLPGELVIKYKNNSTLHKVYFKKNEDINEVIRKYQSDEQVEFVEPNYLFQANLLPDDPFISEQWFLDKIGAYQAWDIVPGGSEEITIAVLDSGVDIEHPDLKQNIWVNQLELVDRIDNDQNGYIDDLNGWDFIENTADPRPKFSSSYTVAGINHGTVVAGIMAAVGNNNQGVIGLAWRVKIMPLRVLNSAGEGNLEAVVKAIEYAMKNKAQIINLSFIGPHRSEILLDIIKKAWQTGILIVAAAGNETTNNGNDLDQNPLYPICLDKDEKENFILGIAAINEKDEKAKFSNYGQSCVDLSAPGTKIFSTLFYSPDKGEFKEYYGGYWSGTSVAAPLVSATAALIKSMNINLTNNEIRNLIINQSEAIDQFNPDYPKKLGQGRLNTYRAVLETYSQIKTPFSNFIVTGPGQGDSPLLKIFRPGGLMEKEFFVYAKNFRGGISLATGDLDGDGRQEIITGAGPGGGPHVRIFDSAGKVKGQFFAYHEKFKGGINLAVGDLNGDGFGEIVVAPQKESLPVRIFDRTGYLLVSFYPYAKNFRGGISLATGDLDGDGRQEIITGAGPGGGPHVRIFDSAGKVKGQFFAYHEKFKGGINLAVGDLNGDGFGEIVVSIASQASPYVRIFNYLDYSSYLRTQFLAYHKDFHKGVYLTIGDLNNDGLAEIITGAGPGGGPHVRIFDSAGKVKGQFFAYLKSFRGGVRISFLKNS